MTVTGLILAGGASRRMGEDKALVEVAGRPMLEIVAAALAGVTDQVVVAGRATSPLGLAYLPDPPGSQHRGPLAGLVAGLDHAAGESVLVVAVDQPWVRPETLTRLAARMAQMPVVPVVDGFRQTTCAVYPTSIAQVAREELAAGGSIQSLLDRTAFDAVVDTEWRSWGEDGRSWFSADDHEAIAEGLRRFGPP